MSEPLVQVENLRTHFFTDAGVVKAVEDVSFSIEKGKTLGVVGESGCGKSVTALSIMQLIAHPGKITGGKITFYEDGKPVVLTDLPESQMRKRRGTRFAMIFQEPMTSLNPVFTVGSQIVEAIRLHRPVTKYEAKKIAIDMLNKVNIPEPERRFKEYPHQFSGGMRQRAMIAMALSCQPDLLIADEPTTALDVTIQAQILDLLRHLQESEQMSIMIITHDLGIIAEMADEVAVMYASKIVERAPVEELFANPRHPYTKGLFSSKPEPGKPQDQRLTTIKGMVPSPLNFPSGCKFHDRCAYAESKDRLPTCAKTEPQLQTVGTNHTAACHFLEQTKDE